MQDKSEPLLKHILLLNDSDLKSVLSRTTNNALILCMYKLPSLRSSLREILSCLKSVLSQETAKSYYARDIKLLKLLLPHLSRETKQRLNEDFEAQKPRVENNAISLRGFVLEEVVSGMLKDFRSLEQKSRSIENTLTFMNA